MVHQNYLSEEKHREARRPTMRELLADVFGEELEVTSNTPNSSLEEDFDTISEFTVKYTNSSINYES